MNILNPKATDSVNTYCFILHVLPFEVKVTQLCPTLVTPWTRAPRLLCPWDSPGKSTGVGCHFLLQGIFSIQELNLGLLHCRQILYQLSYEGSMKTVGGVKSHLESAPIPAREAWRAQTKPCAHQETPQRLSQACP